MSEPPREHPLRRPLRVLSVEDSEQDWFLVRRALDKGGFETFSTRVQSEAGMRDALREEWDLILCDFHLPEFDALGALRLLRESGRDIPFIIVSGTIGEEAAVALLKAGANDFVLKGRLARFIPAVNRELRDAVLRREQHHTEVALAESETRYRQIVETAQEGIWMFDVEGRTTYANRRLTEMLGATPSQLLGTPITDFVEDVAALIPLPTLTTTASRHPQVAFIRPGGTRFWASLSAVPLEDDAHRRMGTLATIVDITEQQKLTEQLMVSDRVASVGTMAAGVAHEINNPLAVIVSNLELAKAGLSEWAEQPAAPNELKVLREELEQATEATQRVRDIVRDLKLFSRGDDQKLSPVTLETVVDSAVRMTRNELRHRAALVRRIPELPKVEANESRLAQVLVNLLVNAAQAIGEGGVEANQVVVDARRAGDWVLLEVSDTGSGMSADVLRHLFTPFFTTKPIGVGTGLGLAICHRIVTSFGGEISATSTVGKGSSFQLKLRVSPTQQAVEVPAPLLPPIVTARGRVLIVDDEPAIGIALRRALERSSQVECFTSARAALDRVAAGERYDVVLCDLMMPEMTGAQFYAAVAQQDAAQAAWIIFLTGGVFSPDMQAFLRSVKNPIIEKPFDLYHVRTMVSETIQRHQGSSRAPPEPGSGNGGTR